MHVLTDTKSCLPFAVSVPSFLACLSCEMEQLQSDVARAFTALGVINFPHSRMIFLQGLTAQTTSRHRQ